MLLQRNSKLQANVGIGQAIAHFTNLGWVVSIPLTDSQKYDLVIDNGSGIQRVQVKITRYTRNGKFEVLLKSIGGSRKKETVDHFDSSASDLVFIYCANGTKYLIPSTKITAQNGISLCSKYDSYKI